MAHVLICFGWKTSNYINHRIHYQTRLNNNQLALSQTMHTVCQPIPSQHVPKILGTQRDAGTWLATALHRRPFSACNKGNRRRLHAGNIQKWPVKMTGQTRVWPVKPTIRPDIVRWLAVILSPALETCEMSTIFLSSQPKQLNLVPRSSQLTVP